MFWASDCMKVKVFHKSKFWIYKCTSSLKEEILILHVELVIHPVQQSSIHITTHRKECTTNPQILAGI